MQEEGGRVRPGRRPVPIRLRRVRGMECGGAATTPPLAKAADPGLVFLAALPSSCIAGPRTCLESGARSCTIDIYMVLSL